MSAVALNTKPPPIFIISYSRCTQFEKIINGLVTNGVPRSMITVHDNGSDDAQTL